MRRHLPLLNENKDLWPCGHQGELCIPFRLPSARLVSSPGPVCFPADAAGLHTCLFHALFPVPGSHAMLMTRMLAQLHACIAIHVPCLTPSQFGRHLCARGMPQSLAHAHGLGTSWREELGVFDWKAQLFTIFTCLVLLKSIATWKTDEMGEPCLQLLLQAGSQCNPGTCIAPCMSPVWGHPLFFFHSHVTRQGV